MTEEAEVFVDRRGSRMEVVDAGSDARPMVLEYHMAPRLSGPPVHLHPRLAERFEVQAGTLSMEMAGRPRQVHADEVVDVPAGMPHTLHNRSDGWVQVRITVNPAMQMRAFFRDVCAIDRTYRGPANTIRLAMLCMRHRADVYFLPPAGPGLVLLAGIGRLLRLAM